MVLIYTPKLWLYMKFWDKIIFTSKFYAVIYAYFQLYAHFTDEHNLF